MASTTNVKLFEQRIRDRLNSFVNPSEIGGVLDIFGELVAGQAKLRARAYPIADTGNLINRIRAVVSVSKTSMSVTVGVPRVGYAAFQEEGAMRNESTRRAMFANLRERGTLGKKAGTPGFSPSQAPARPFLVPAFKQMAPRLIDMLRQLARR